MAFLATSLKETATSDRKSNDGDVTAPIDLRSRTKTEEILKKNSAIVGTWPRKRVMEK